MTVEDLKEADLSDIRSAFICDIKEYDNIWTDVKAD